MKEDSLKAAITIEAAVIIPLINVVIIICLLVGMLCHDRCVVKGVVEKYMSDMSFQGNEMQIKEEVTKLVKNKVIMSRAFKVEVKHSLSDISVCVYLDNPVLNGFFGEGFATGVKVKTPKYTGLNVVRVFSVVIETINGN